MKLLGPRQHGLKSTAIDRDALKIIDRLQRHGYEAYVVGGGVRDLLLRKEPKDFDIATSATPNEVKKVFRNSRIIGRRFKLVHIYFRNNKIIEVSTFRGEESDNVYGTIESDALRRDLTINALFYDPTSGFIHDYVGGYKDITSRKIKIIGEPSERFEQDPIRMIRALRHQARTGFALDTHAKKAIAEQAHLLDECPPMRIYEELKKDLMSGYFQEIFGLLKEFKLLPYLLPEIRSNIDKKEIYLQDFIFCIKGADRAALEDRLSSISPILAVIAIFMLPNFDLREDLKTYFKNQQSIQEFFMGCFKKLQVPRKIKHEIVLLFRMIWLLEKAEQKGRKFKLTRPELRTELKLLLKLLNINKHKNHLNRIFRFH